MRVVFDAVTASLNSYTTKQALLTRTPNASATLESLQEEDEESSAPAGRRASDRLKASRKEVAAPVIDLLEKIAEDRSTELAQICRFWPAKEAFGSNLCSPWAIIVYSRLGNVFPGPRQ